MKNKDIIYEFKENIAKELEKHKSPQEPIIDRVSVGSDQDLYPIRKLWQVHSFRRYFDYNKSTFNQNKPSEPSLTELSKAIPMFNKDYTCTSANHNKEFHYKKFLFFYTIIVKKNQIQIYNNSHQKMWRLIRSRTKSGIDQRIDEVIDELELGCIKALGIFIRIHKGKSNYKILRRKEEHGIHDEGWIKNIPESMVFEDTVVKKKYKEKPELYTITGVKNYFTNRAVEEVAPQIADGINLLGDNLTKNMNLIVSTMDKGFKSLISQNNRVLSDNKDSIKELKVDLMTFNRDILGKFDTLTKEALIPLTEQIKLHLEVQRKTLELQKKTSKTMDKIQEHLKTKESFLKRLWKRN